MFGIHQTCKSRFDMGLSWRLTTEVLHFAAARPSLEPLPPLRRSKGAQRGRELPVLSTGRVPVAFIRGMASEYLGSSGKTVTEGTNTPGKSRAPWAWLFPESSSKNTGGPLTFEQTSNGWGTPPGSPHRSLRLRGGRRRARVGRVKRRELELVEGRSCTTHLVALNTRVVGRGHPGRKWVRISAFDEFWSMVLGRPF